MGDGPSDYGWNPPMQEQTQRCEWFLLCRNPADGFVAHPALGRVPTCERCRAKFNMRFITKEDS